MAFDPKGRLIVSPEGDTPLLRLTITGPEDGGDRAESRNPSDRPWVCSTPGTVFFLTARPMGWGIYRMRARGDAFGSPEMLCPLGFSRTIHTALTALFWDPDDKLYVVCGDHTQLPTDISPSSPFQNFAEDELLPDEPGPTGWDPRVCGFRKGLSLAWIWTKRPPVNRR